MGAMKYEGGGRRAVALSHEDLADLCRFAFIVIVASLVSLVACFEIECVVIRSLLNIGDTASGSGQNTDRRKQQPIDQSSSLKTSLLVEDDGDDDDIPFMWTDSTNSDASTDSQDVRATSTSPVSVNTNGLASASTTTKRLVIKTAIGLRNTALPSVALISDPAYGPITRVLWRRGFHELFFDVSPSLPCVYCNRFIFALA